MGSVKQLLIDTDPGTDDAIAMAMALNAPQAQVAGVTITAGNASITHCVRNALAVLEHMGRTDVPVAVGAERALAGKFAHAYDFHGHRGIGIRFPRPGTSSHHGGAVDFMAQTLGVYPKSLSLVALGPLTNIARLLKRYPDTRENIGELIVMGGALERGNATPYAEFNTYSDPEAADIVFASHLPVRLVPLEACRQVVMQARDLRRYRDEKVRAARLTYRILRRWFERRGFDQWYDPCDPVALVLALVPEFATYDRGVVVVDTGNGDTRGRTLFRSGPGNVSVAREVNAAGLHHFMDCLLKAG